jgi:hypothetical protein
VVCFYEHLAVLTANCLLEGELVDFIEEFSDGRIQFAFLKVKDPNTTLPKNVFVCWVRQYYKYVVCDSNFDSAVKEFPKEPKAISQATKTL